jgi:histone H3/H4
MGRPIRKTAPKKAKTCYLSAPRVTLEIRDLVLAIVGGESMAAWIREAVIEKLIRDTKFTAVENGSEIITKAGVEMLRKTFEDMLKNET